MFVYSTIMTKYIIRVIELINLKIHVAFWELGIRCTIRRNDGKFSIQTISSNYYGEREDR